MDTWNGECPVSSTIMNTTGPFDWAFVPYGTNSELPLSVELQPFNELLKEIASDS